MKIFTHTTLVTMVKALLIALLIAPQALVAQCVYVDFTYAIGANGQVTFTDISGINNPTSRTWSFGDGAINILNVANPVHSYNIANATTPSVCFDVTLTVNAGGNTGVSQPKQVCIPRSTLSGGTSLFVKIISPTEIYDGGCNTELVKVLGSTVLEQNPTSFEASVLGGTPPYSFKWTFPSSAPSPLFGQGPHAVTFADPPVTGIIDNCSTNTVNVEVTDARGVQGSASVKISVRRANEGPGIIKVVAGKSPICVGDIVNFKVKVDNPFSFGNFLSGVSFAASYKWVVDGRTHIEAVGWRTANITFTEGLHTVGLEVTDNGTTYVAKPTTFTVRSEAACNIEPPIIPNFELKVNGAPNGSVTLDASNNGNLCTGSVNRKITVRLRKSNIFISPSQTNEDCLPNYFFSIWVKTADGTRRMLEYACNVDPNAIVDPGGRAVNIASRGTNIVTDVLLEYLNPSYINRADPNFVEFTLPLCFASCGPLVGCNELEVIVGRYRAKPSLYLNNPCECAFDGYMGGYGPDQQNYNPKNGCNTSLANTTPLMGNVATLKSTACAIKVEGNYPPLSISGITTSPFNCRSNNTYTFTIGAITGGIPFDLSSTSGYIGCGSPYKAIKWKAFYFNNPNREITGDFFDVSNTDPKKAIVSNLSHSYFINNFAAGEQRLFIVEASIADWDGNIAKYSMLVAFDAPLAITLPPSIKRCKSDDVTLSDIPVVQGGKMPYTYSWSATSAIFKDGTTTPVSTSNVDIPSLNLSNSANSVTITLEVTDANMCRIKQNITLDIATLNSFSLGTGILTACANSSSVLSIGPINCPSLNCLGGSGAYRFTWSATNPDHLNNLSDPTSAYPKVIGLPTSMIGQTQTFKLVVTDLYGGCSIRDASIEVQSEETLFSVNLGPDKTLCSTNNDKLTATLIGGGPDPSVFTYKWESTAPNVPTNTTSREIALNSLPTGASYTYKVTVIYPKSNCSTTDEVIVNTKKAWTYSGYESVIAPLVAGNRGPLWASNDNEVFVNNTYNSGAVPYFSYSLPHSPEVADPVTGNYLAITQGYFTPEGDNYNAKVLMTDKNGCTQEFVSNTYYLLSSNPNVTVSTDKQVVCSGGEICFYLKLNTNILTGHQHLPVSFKTPYNLKQAYLLENGTWYYTGDVGRGFVEFVLTDASAGVYTAVACVKIPNVGNLSQFAFLIEDGLPNFKVTGDGTFRVEHQFNASPSYGGIRSEYRKAGSIRETYPRQIAYNFVSLGSEYYVDWLGRQQWQFNRLDIARDAYAEFAASRVGEVRIEQDVDIQEDTRYFHAFIDRCLTSKDKFKEDEGEGESTYLIRKSNPLSSIKNIFSVHPSPFTNTITLDYEVRTEKGSNVSLCVYNGIGQIVDKIFDNRFHNFGVFSTTYDTGKLQSGIYLFELTIDGEKIVKKSMKVD